MSLDDFFGTVKKKKKDVRQVSLRIMTPPENFELLPYVATGKKIEIPITARNKKILEYLSYGEFNVKYMAITMKISQRAAFVEMEYLCTLGLVKRVEVKR